MNIEIANRLCELRKKNGLSQEQLAEKIGVSRQAVSKWERAEASPDTDNLIALAEIYNVSIDQILTGKCSNTAENGEQSDSGGTYAESKKPKDGTNYKKSNVSFKNGIHIEDGEEKVHIGFDGIHVLDKNGTKVSVDKKGVFVEENGETKAYTDENGDVYYKDGVKHVDMFGCDDKKTRKKSVAARLIESVGVPIIAVIGFLILGFVCNLWYVAWIVFLAIPIIFSISEVIETKRLSKFCYPVLVVAVYLLMGFLLDLWHPGWIIFLTIPIFYGVCGVFENK